LRHGASSSAKRLIVRRFGYDGTHGGKKGLFVTFGKDDTLLINNRQQNSRRRGRGGQRPQGNSGGGGRNQDNGNRIDNRSRGNAAQMLEKYKTLARDSQQAGDRVLTEYYLQFADHYFRVLADTRARFEENQPRRDDRDGDAAPQQGYEGEESFESDDVDEFYPRTQPQQTAQQSPRQQRYDRDDSRNDGRNDRNENRDREPRQDYQRQDAQRQDSDRQPREDNRPRRDYGDQPRSNGNGAGHDDTGEQRRDARPLRENAHRDEPRPAREPREPRAPRNAPEQSTLSIDILPPAIATAPVEAAEDAPAPKRRGRPKKAESEAAAE
jgi:Domain of unknown function (DUF4167)